VIGGFLTIVLAGIVALALLAKIVRVPYPVVFVVGGLVLALIPGVPTIELDPNLVFLLFLPPLIFGDGWTSDARLLARFRRPILSLSIGLVIGTSVAVAYLVHWMIGVPLAVGFALGGILAPTDAVATGAITQIVPLPRRLVAVIDGESLINDASGLVVYRFAIVAIATGAFSLLTAAFQFVYVVVVGILVGLVGAWALAKLMKLIRRKGLSDPLIAASVSLITPFAVYVPADALHASGVLAVLACALAMSQIPSLFDPESRLQTASVWTLLIFTFNGAAFALIGLQLRSIVHALARYSLWTLIGWTLALTAALVVVRFAWAWVALYLPYRLSPRAREGTLTWQAVTIVALTGLRGIVSLAAALAIPTVTAGGVAFPDRDLVLFLTFGVVLVTLVGGSLVLPPVLAWLGPQLHNDGPEQARAMARARHEAAQAARARLRELEPTLTSSVDWEIAGRLEGEYDQRLALLEASPDGDAARTENVELATERRLRREAYAAERGALERLRRSGTIGADVFRDIEWEIDLADSSLG
jgi:CPA1 family monovalent cation:H+ antiporter